MRLKAKSGMLRRIPWWQDDMRTEVRWEGEDFGLGIAEHLNQNVLVPAAFREDDSFEIQAYPDRGCWILTVEEVLAPKKKVIIP